mmetsp:Transcript_81953/g.211180  ORF Transcript_81953/g.211180 Transcript_81953/m.211180 type:complete len:168 (+) Transcript_81953:173-676(+)
MRSHPSWPQHQHAVIPVYMRKPGLMTPFVIINFVNQAEASRALSWLSGQPWSVIDGRPTGKVIKMQPARVQGMSANVALHSRSFHAPRSLFFFDPPAEPMKLPTAVAIFCPDDADVQHVLDQEKTSVGRDALDAHDAQEASAGSAAALDVLRLLIQRHGVPPPGFSL